MESAYNSGDETDDDFQEIEEPEDEEIEADL